MDDFTRLTYPRQDREYHTLNDNLLCPLDQSTACRAPQFDLGRLNRLPLELLDLILVQLDLRTLTDFRRVNQRAMQAVDHVREYNFAKTHAPDVLRGILSIETGRWVACKRLYDVLHTPDCDLCGSFGGYIYALTCRRVCFHCVSGISTFTPISYPLASRRHLIPKDVLDTLPQMRTVPGIYSTCKVLSTTRHRMVDLQSVIDAVFQIYGSFSNLQRRYQELEERSSLSETERRQLSQAERRDGGEYGNHPGNPILFEAIIRAPAFDPASGHADWGVQCIGNKNPTGGNWGCRRLFSRATFPEHLQNKGPIVDGMHQPPDGSA